jgi:hypothetical protein
MGERAEGPGEGCDASRSCSRRHGKSTARRFPPGFMTVQPGAMMMFAAFVVHGDRHEVAVLPPARGQRQIPGSANQEGDTREDHARRISAALAAG